MAGALVHCRETAPVYGYDFACNIKSDPLFIRIITSNGSGIGEKKLVERTVSDKGALKQGSLIESKKTMEKKEKKSIHERLKINKEIIAKKQGKDSKEKGVELA